MRDEPVLLPDREADAANRRAARALAWWGRIAFALWILEAALQSGAWLWKLPVWILAIATEIVAPGLREGRGLGGAEAIHWVGLPVFGFLLWELADGKVSDDPRRLLAFTFAATLLGAISAWRTASARRHSLPVNRGRRPEAIEVDRRIAIAVTVMGLPPVIALTAFALAVGADMGIGEGLKGLVLALYFLALLIRVGIAVKGGTAVGFVGTLVLVAATVGLLVALVASFGGGLLGFFVVGLPVGGPSLVALLFLGSCASSVGPRSPTPWNQDRPSDGAENPLSDNS